MVTGEIYGCDDGFTDAGCGATKTGLAVKGAFATRCTDGVGKGIDVAGALFDAEEKFPSARRGNAPASAFTVSPSSFNLALSFA